MRQILYHSAVALRPYHEGTEWQLCILRFTTFNHTRAEIVVFFLCNMHVYKHDDNNTMISFSSLLAPHEMSTSFSSQRVQHVYSLFSWTENSHCRLGDTYEFHVADIKAKRVCWAFCFKFFFLMCHWTAKSSLERRDSR